MKTNIFDTIEAISYSCHIISSSGRRPAELMGWCAWQRYVSPMRTSFILITFMHVYSMIKNLKMFY